MKLFLLLFIFLAFANIYSSDFYYYGNNGEKIYPTSKYKNYLVCDSISLKKSEKILNTLGIKVIDKRQYEDIVILKLSQPLNSEKPFRDKGIKFYKYFNEFENWPVIIAKRGVLKLNDGFNIDEISKKYGFKVVSYLKDIDLYVIYADKILPLLNSMKEDNIAKIAQPDFLLPHEKMFIPNDPYFNIQWHLSYSGDVDNVKETANVKADDAWDLEKGNPQIKIAIIDDGMDVEHLDLKDKILYAHNFLDHDDNVGNNGGDEAFHGTSCAGVAAAKGDNEIGVIGACPKCSLISARILGLDSSGNYVPGSVDAKAIIWAAGGDSDEVQKIDGADIINCSWGFQQPVELPYPLKNAIDYAVTNGRNGKGSVVVFASGNDGRRYENYELTAYQNVITVGASTDGDVRARYSNYGMKLDFLAPSNGGRHGICTTDYHGIAGYNDGHLPPEVSGDYTCTFGGTSSATPLVSGIIGLILSKNPDLNWKEVRNILRASCDKINENYVNYQNGWNEQYGYGRVNAYKALKLASSEMNDIGNDCQSDEDCYFECIDKENFKNGFCTLECSSGYCPQNSVCVDNIDVRGVKKAYCLTVCENRDDCKDGYACGYFNDYDTQSYCIPGCSVTGCNGKLRICNAETEMCEDDINNPCWNKAANAPKICRERFKSCNEETGNCECVDGYFETETGDCVEDLCLKNNVECKEHSSCAPIIGECICDKGYVKNGSLCIKEKKQSSSCSYGERENAYLFILIFLFIFIKRKKIKYSL